jgi:hypothetical protein
MLGLSGFQMISPNDDCDVVGAVAGGTMTVENLARLRRVQRARV